MNFKVCSFCLTLWRLNLVNISYRFAFEAMFMVGIPLENSIWRIGTSFDAVEA